MKKINFYRDRERSALSKLVLYMKVTTLLLFVSMITVSANSLAQQTKFNLKVSNANILEVFEKLEEQTDFGFVFQADQLNLSKRFNFDKNSVTLPEVLNEVLNDESVSFRIIDSNVIIVERDAPKSVVQQQQSGTIKGKVIDAKGEPIPGVNVYEKGTTNGVITGIDGTYAINTSNADVVVVFSFIGFEEQEVNVAGRSTVDITLVEEVTGLDEVVVVGYGTMKKSDINGSVVSVKAEDIQSASQVSVDQMLQGRVAGVSIKQKGGQPGAGTSIRIRGASSLNSSNEPLYVIDGAPISNNTNNSIGVGATSASVNPLSTINPSDIESIEVLKDASATAIYGSRGANGVILITTKRGKQGAVKVTYDANYGLQKLMRKIDVLSSEQYINHIDDIIKQENPSDPDAGIFENYADPTVNNDWQSLLFQDKFIDDGNVAKITNHNISLTGGGENTQTFASVGYTDHDGIAPGSEFKRYSLRLNSTYTKGKFRAFANINTSYTNDKQAQIGDGFNSTAGLVNLAINLPSSMPLYTDDGERFIPGDLDFDNPFNIIDGSEVVGKTSRTMANLDLSYELLAGLTLSGKVSTDYVFARKDAYASTLTQTGLVKNGLGIVKNTERGNYVFEGLLNYNKVLDAHRLEATIGSTYQKYNYRTSYLESSGFVSDYSKTDNLSEGDREKFWLDTYRSSSAIMSYLGRFNYAFKDKYTATLTMRADGDSQFQEGNKWGYFPSVGLGWRLSEEGFLSSADAIDNLKVRAGWGQIGNSTGVGNSAYVTHTASGDAVYGSRIDKGIQVSRMANPDLTWETTEQVNFGVDYSLLNFRINGSVDIYSKTTKDLLFWNPVSPQTGFADQKINLKDSDISNKGIEIAINTVNIKTNAFTWETNFNLSHNKTVVNKLTGNDITVFGNDYPSTIIREGESPWSYYGLVADGVWQLGEEDAIADSAQPDAKPGDPRWQNVSDTSLDENGEIIKNISDADDAQILGDPFPDFTWGMTNILTYKKWQFSFFFEGSHGAEMFNYQYGQSFDPMNKYRNRMSEVVLGRWTPDNPTNDMPSLVNPDSYGGTVTNSYTIEDASFVRLKDIKLTYNFDMSKVDFISSFSAYVSASNVALWTEYSGFDPDVASGESNRRYDLNSYPSVSTVAVGINVAF